MNTLQELTDKIYAEGVEKGKNEAAQIVSEAEAKAAAIIAAAEKEAAEKIQKAEQKAAELDKNTRAELKLYADQSVSAVKTELTNLLSEKLASESVKAATADKAFMQKLIMDLAQQLAQQGDVVVSAKDADALKAYVAANLKGALEKGLTITEVKGQKVDFSIAPAKGGYKLNFSDAELIAYFKDYLRPQIVEMLF